MPPDLLGRTGSIRRQDWRLCIGGRGFAEWSQGSHELGASVLAHTCDAACGSMQGANSHHRVTPAAIAYLTRGELTTDLRDRLHDSFSF